MNVIPVNITGDEFISTDEGKQHCYVSGSKWDSKIDNFIKSTREFAEGITWRLLIAGTYKMILDNFPCGEIMELPRYPVKSVDEITYIDPDGNEQTLNSDAYVTDTFSLTTRIQVIDSWPSTKDQVNAVSVTFTGGYDGTDPRLTIPQNLVDAMLFTIKHRFDNRSSVEVSESRSLDAKEVPQTAMMIFEMESLRTPA